MKESYEVIISKQGRLITMALVETLAEANKIKDNILGGPATTTCFAGKCVIIEKTVTTQVSTTPFTGINLTN